MRKVLIIVFFGVVLGLIAFWFIRNPEAFQKVYVWLIGLFGIITWPFRKLWDWLNSNDELKEIEQSNQQLKAELVQIKKDLALAQRKLDQARKQNKVKIEALQHSIRQEDQKAQTAQQKLAESRAQSLEDFEQKLTPEELQKKKQILNEIDFGL
jgi:hypothetical protein